MGQSFLCLCTASRERRMEVAFQFYIFLTSSVFGVERSAVRLCFFTPLYPTDTKLGISHDWYRFSGDGWSFCWCQESTLALSQRSRKFYWFNSRRTQAENVWRHSCKVCYSIFSWHRSNIFWSIPHESMMSFWRVFSFRKIIIPLSYTLKIGPLFLSVTLALLTQPRAIIIHTNVTWLLRTVSPNRSWLTGAVKMFI